MYFLCFVLYRFIFTPFLMKIIGCTILCLLVDLMPSQITICQCLQKKVTERRQLHLKVSPNLSLKQMKPSLSSAIRSPVFTQVSPFTNTLFISFFSVCCLLPLQPKKGVRELTLDSKSPVSPGWTTQAEVWTWVQMKHVKSAGSRQWRSYLFLLADRILADPSLVPLSPCRTSPGHT